MVDPSAQLTALDRVVSRSVAVIGLLSIAVVWFASGKRLPPSAIVAFAAVYSLAKFALGAMGLIRGWKAWPALFVEGAAIALVGAIVWARNPNPIPLVACAVLLLGAGMWRSRVRASEGT